MIFYPVSELMLATLIQRYDKKSFHFKNERPTEVLQAGATFYVYINTIFQFIKPFLDNKKSIFEEYGAFERRFRNSQIAIITNFVVVSSVGIKRIFRGLDTPDKFSVIFDKGDNFVVTF